MSSSSSLWFASFPSWTGESVLHDFASRISINNFPLFFSVDICQFSLTSMFTSSEDKTRSISFRSIILIMTYAGTIILNLLAASIDNNFTGTKALSAENSTMAGAMDSMEDNDTVLVERTQC